MGNLKHHRPVDEIIRDLYRIKAEYTGRPETELRAALAKIVAKYACATRTWTERVKREFASASAKRSRQQPG